MSEKYHIFATMYHICHRCGALHDDGTLSLCFNCLGEIEQKYPNPDDASKVYKMFEFKGDVDNG